MVDWGLMTLMVLLAACCTGLGYVLRMVHEGKSVKREVTAIWEQATLAKPAMMTMPETTHKFRTDRGPTVRPPHWTSIKKSLEYLDNPDRKTEQVVKAHEGVNL